MRTSVTLDDDIYELATLYARGKRITLGAAIGELVRRGESAPHSGEHSPGLVREPNGLLVFASRDRAITSEMVKKHQEDEIE